MWWRTYSGVTGDWLTVQRKWSLESLVWSQLVFLIYQIHLHQFGENYALAEETCVNHFAQKMPNQTIIFCWSTVLTLILIYTSILLKIAKTNKQTKNEKQKRVFHWHLASNVNCKVWVMFVVILPFRSDIPLVWLYGSGNFVPIWYDGELSSHSFASNQCCCFFFRSLVYTSILMQNPFYYSIIIEGLSVSCAGTLFWCQITHTLFTLFFNSIHLPLIVGKWIL